MNKEDYLNRVLYGPFRRLHDGKYVVFFNIGNIGGVDYRVEGVSGIGVIFSHKVGGIDEYLEMFKQMSDPDSYSRKFIQFLFEEKM